MDICSLIPCTGCETRVCDKVQSLLHQRSGDSSCPWDNPGAAAPFCWGADVAGRAFGAFLTYPEWSEPVVQPSPLGEPWLYLQVWPWAVLPGPGGRIKTHWHMSPSPLCQTVECRCPWKLVLLEHFRFSWWSWCRKEMIEIQDVNALTVLCCLPEGITPPACHNWPNSCPEELAGVHCPDGMCIRGEGGHSEGAGSWICYHKILILWVSC